MTAILLSSLNGNSQMLDGGAMFGNAPRAVWEKWLTPDSKNRIPLSCRCLLVEIDGKRVLCEAGIGAFFEPKMAERYGVTESNHVLLESLANIGLKDSDIDFVILSHLHFDHAGGLLAPWQADQSEPNLLFPNAKFVVGKTAFNRAERPHPRDRASFIPKLQELLTASRRLILVDGDTHPSVLPQLISFHFSHGHTPGHMHTIITSPQHQKVVFAGDLIPGTSWVHLPITMGYDRFAELVIDEKKSFYDQFANEHTWLFYTHDHRVSLSKIKKSDDGRYSADQEQFSITRMPLP